MEYWIRIGITTALIVVISVNLDKTSSTTVTPNTNRNLDKTSSTTVTPNTNKNMIKTFPTTVILTQNTPIPTTVEGKANLTCRKPVINGTECAGNKKCPINNTCDDPSQCLCMDGYSSYNATTGRYRIYCEDIHECKTNIHDCGAHTGCQNTDGGYFCKCNKGFHKGNVTEFCPTNNRAENVCSDIDECENTTICGPNSNCMNKLGSYTCECWKGFKNVSNNCTVRCREENELKPACNDATFKCKLDTFIELNMPWCKDNSNLGRLNMDKLLDDLDVLISQFRNSDKTKRLRTVGILLNTVERTIQNLAYLFHEGMPFSNKNNYISAKMINKTSNREITLSNRNSSIRLDLKTALGNAYTSVVGCLEYGNIGHLLAGADLRKDSKNQRVKLVSPVVSVFLGVANTANLSKPIQLHLNFSQEKVKWNETHCAFWSVSAAAWSTEGCVTLERNPYGIVCNCTHLTSFAVLMALKNIQSWALELITQIGLSISIVCLFLAIITFCCCRFLRGTRNTIHIHLCVSLLLGHCIFLIGIEATSDRAVCGIVAGLLHFFYLSSFCWMSLEGLELYLMLVTVFKTQVKTRYLLAVGYGVPTVIITISAAVFPSGYGTEEYCWLSMEQNFVWSFMGPVCVIILVNCGIFVLTVWKLAEKMTTINPEQGKLKRMRSLTVTSIAQLCILGCCWAFGFLMFGSATLFFAYAFTICNVLQGVQIFILHCLMNKKVRETYSNVICAIAHLRSPLYSEFSNSTNVNTQSRAKLSKESGL